MSYNQYCKNQHRPPDRKAEGLGFLIFNHWFVSVEPGLIDGGDIFQLFTQ